MAPYTVANIFSWLEPGEGKETTARVGRKRTKEAWKGRSWDEKATCNTKTGHTDGPISKKRCTQHSNSAHYIESNNL